MQALSAMQTSSEVRLRGRITVNSAFWTGILVGRTLLLWHPNWQYAHNLFSIVGAVVVPTVSVEKRAGRKGIDEKW